MIKKDIIDLIK